MGKINVTNFKRAINYMKKNGLSAMLTLAAERLESHAYDEETYEPLSEEELEAQRRDAGSYSVKFSILVPAFNTPKDYFRKMIESVEEQTYPNWELLIGDAGDVEAGLKDIAEEYNDMRVRYVKLGDNLGISGNTNELLKLAKGDYVALLDHDDFLTPDALYENAKLISKAQVTPR
ncbi:MAG: glycosyltransferase, partial [Lachnospiraceae bacterium]|nr:glycosyltransferase [Lachnospiraceae bacterium]